MSKELPLNDPRIYMGALDRQVGGEHYKDGRGGIQPVEFIERNGLPFCMGNVIKYLYRWKLKGGKVDLDKAIHYCELAMSMYRPCVADSDDTWEVRPDEFIRSNKLSLTEARVVNELCAVYTDGLQAYLRAYELLKTLAKGWE